MTLAPKRTSKKDLIYEVIKSVYFLLLYPGYHDSLLFKFKRYFSLTYIFILSTMAILENQENIILYYNVITQRP